MPPAATPSAPASGRPFVRATALVPVLRHFEAQHEALAEIVGAEGLDLAALRDPYEEIPLSAYLTIFEGAARAAKDPVLGARLGRAITPADLGPTGCCWRNRPPSGAGCTVSWGRWRRCRAPPR